MFYDPKNIEFGHMQTNCFFRKQSYISGNRGWSAAEIIEGSKSLTPAIDSFSIGCILFFCISKGEHLFGHNTNVELLERCIQQNQPKNLYIVNYFCKAHDLISKFDPNLR